MEASLGWLGARRAGARSRASCATSASATPALRELELSRARYRALVANLPNVIVALFNTDEQLLVMEGGQLARRGLRARRLRRAAR